MRLGHGPRRTVVLLWLWTALLSGLALIPTYISQGNANALVPIGALALALLLYVFFFPGRKEAQADRGGGGGRGRRGRGRRGGRGPGPGHRPREPAAPDRQLSRGRTATKICRFSRASACVLRAAGT